MKYIFFIFIFFIVYEFAPYIPVGAALAPGIPVIAIYFADQCPEPTIHRSMITSVRYPVQKPLMVMESPFLTAGALSSKVHCTLLKSLPGKIITGLFCWFKVTSLTVPLTCSALPRYFLLATSSSFSYSDASRAAVSAITGSDAAERCGLLYILYAITAPVQINKKHTNPAMRIVFLFIQAVIAGIISCYYAVLYARVVSAGEFFRIKTKWITAGT